VQLLPRSRNLHPFLRCLLPGLCLLSLVQCADGLGPDPDDYPPIIDEVQNLAGETIQSARMGETVVLVGRNLFGQPRVFFGDGEAAVLSVSGDGTRIETAVPTLASPGPVLIRVEVAGRSSNELSFQVTSSRTYFVGGSMLTVVMEDLDRDGVPDLIVDSLFDSHHPDSFPEGRALVYLGKGDGTFTEAGWPDLGGAYFRLEGVADLDSDGVPDLLGYTLNGRVILPGRGDGSFGEARVLDLEGGEEIFGRVLIEDFDRDGNQDLAALTLDRVLLIFRGNGDGTFRAPLRLDPALELHYGRLTAGDLNRDGAPDLVMDAGVLLGNGDGTFRQAMPFDSAWDPTVPIYGHNKMVLADLDLDGNPDLVLEGRVLLGAGDGTFGVPLPYEWEKQASLAVGDVDGDRVPDLVICGIHDTLSILLGNRDGTFRAGAGDDGTGTAFSGGWGSSVVLLADLDGDGDGDLALTRSQSGSLSVLPGNGDGTFGERVTFPAGEEPADVISGDLDGDGLEDLAVACGGPDAPGTVSVLLGRGDGIFRNLGSFETGPEPRSLALGDFDRDGRPDLPVALRRRGPFSAGGVSVLLGSGGGRFGRAVRYLAGWTPVAVEAADLDRDGRPDLAVIYASDFHGGDGVVAGTAVLLGRGDGTFRPAVVQGHETASSSMALGDLNGDGVPDLALTPWAYDDYGDRQALAATVRMGRGDGTFGVPVDLDAAGEGIGSVAAVDLDGDGDLDLAVANCGRPVEYLRYLGHVTVLRGNGDGTFGAPARNHAYGQFTAVTAADLDGDGDPDLALASPWASGVAVMLGKGDGSLGDAVSYVAAPGASALAAGDFDGDGIRAGSVERKAGLQRFRPRAAAGADFVFRAQPPAPPAPWLRCRPTTPRMISASDTALSGLKLSRNHTMPMAAISAVPTADHTA